jgi:CubicO group peptidase (beta-lactamase class C family)
MPEYSFLAKGVQLRHVLAHTAGLPDFDRSCGWGGWGGSLVMVDLDARMTVSYVTTQMLDQGLGDYRGLGIVMAAYDGVP